MKWTVLGYQSPYPGPQGATPGYLLEVEGKRILVDCGSGVLAQLSQYCRPDQLDAVFLSHLHHDHIADFFVLQYSLLTAKRLGRRAKPLPVFAPLTPEKWGRLLPYHEHIQLTEIREGMEVEVESLKVSFYQTDHGVPCFAMVFSCDGIITLYGADAGPKTDWSRMTHRPDLFICEATFLEQDLPKKPLGHLSARQAAEAATRIGAKRLLLTHFFPEYDLQAVAEEGKGSFSGELWLAHCGLVISL